MRNFINHCLLVLMLLAPSSLIFSISPAGDSADGSFTTYNDGSFVSGVRRGVTKIENLPNGNYKHTTEQAVFRERKDDGLGINMIQKHVRVRGPNNKPVADANGDVVPDQLQTFYVGEYGKSEQSYDKPIITYHQPDIDSPDQLQSGKKLLEPVTEMTVKENLWNVLVAKKAADQQAQHPAPAGNNDPVGDVAP